MIYTEETIEKNTVFDGKVFEVRSDKSKLGNGEIQSREVVIHSGGVTIAAEENDKMIF